MPMPLRCGTSTRRARASGAAVAVVAERDPAFERTAGVGRQIRDRPAIDAGHLGCLVEVAIVEPSIVADG